jgi:hemerythrin-like domain-containing protein
LAARLATQGADPDARSAAASVMRYFDTSARDHHADEEVDLFPALIESMAGSDAVCLRELTATLTAEHRELESRWRAVRNALERVSAGDPVALPADAVQGFIDLYQRHIAREEAELLPMARRLLSDADLDRIGLAMRERRGVAVDH